MENEFRRQFMYVIVVAHGCLMKISKKKLLKILDGMVESYDDDKREI